MVCTGLDALAGANFAALRGRKVGVVCNQATVTRGLDHLLDLIVPLHRQGSLCLGAVFGPQHGLFGHTQDNMIEWEGSSDSRLSVPIHSLYGAVREPTREMLDGIELLVVDLPDIGSRYYTFIWTLALCMKACESARIPVLVLDRPNPIGGVQVEGTVLDPDFASFVGLYPLPLRHGMTLGEIAVHLNAQHFPRCSVTVERVENWNRERVLDETGLPWVMPSPNMPALDTAIVYPGGCLIEGTNLSEGRGTTRPFEMVGAPYLDGWRFADALNRMGLPGVRFRPIEFQPTFQKHAGEICGGCFIHVKDRAVFEPVLTTVAVLQEARRQAGDRFTWNPPPYEYETVKLPIDILAGNGWLATAIDALTPLAEIRERFVSECAGFAAERDAALLY